MTPKPFNSGFLPEQTGHQVYFAQFGNPQAPAIVVLHGGPGSQSKPKHIQKFDFTKFHIITFDQRGCGQSLPLGEIKNNTKRSDKIFKLLKDLEIL